MIQDGLIIQEKHGIGVHLQMLHSQAGVDALYAGVTCGHRHMQGSTACLRVTLPAVQQPWQSSDTSSHMML
jgi:hypothetical protein